MPRRSSALPSTSAKAGGTVLAGLVLYPFSKAKEALTLYRDFATSIPDEVRHDRRAASFAEGEPVAAIAVCYNGSLEGERSCAR